MEEEYNEVVAGHYFAYRPPLHDRILARCIPENERFDSGLDIGSGTGHSAIALAKFCKSVSAVEPSPAMISRAIPHESVNYFQASGDQMPFPDHSFDMITFAGSLFYVKSQKLVDEVFRVSRRPATILLYDFDVQLKEVTSMLGVKLPEEDYDHTIDFSGLDQRGIEKKFSNKEEINLEINTTDLGHLLLSTRASHQIFAQKFDLQDPLLPLVENLERDKGDKMYLLPVTIYFTSYTVTASK